MPKIFNNKTSWSKFSFRKILGLILRFFGIHLLIGLIAAITALVFFGWLAEDIFEGETITFDETIRNAVHQTAAPMLTETMKVFSIFGSTLFLVALGICVAAAFFYLHRKRAFVLFVATMLGETIILNTLKVIFQRARPEPFFDYALPSSYSFPSGHSLSSFCFYGILAWLITARMENQKLKIPVWTLAAILIFFIGLSRVYLGVHYPSDVLAGFAAGLVWVVTVGFGDFFLERRSSSKI
jgi:undecaprenyl-diphosphatase